MPDTNHLRLFRDIAREGSISRGAEQNGISQSAASQHLQELERQLGVLLVDRSTRPIELTPAGRLYLEYCRDVLRLERDFEVALEELKEEEGGTARVACIYSVGLSEMTRLKAEFLQRNPGASLEVEYLRPERVYEAVEAGRAELGLVSYPRGTHELAVLPWREERMVVALAPGHPLANRERLEPEELEGQDFVAFDADLPIRREIDRFLAGRGVSVRIAMEFDNIPMVKEALALGAALSILPGPMLQADVEQGRLRAIALGGELVRPIGIVHRRRKPLPRAAKLFLELLQAGVREPAYAGSR